jgi:Uncharacterized protein conserved in bacteria
MSKKLIVVADDFGFSEAYSLGALKAYKEGIVTVLSLMSNMDAAEFAVNLAKKEAPEVCLAQHTNFVQGKPVAKDVPSMTDEYGYLYRSSQWAPSKEWSPESALGSKLKGTVVVSYEDIYKETMAQLNRFKELVGAYPVHFEGHSVGTPDIKKAFRTIGKELGIHNMYQEAEDDKMYYAHELALSNSKYIEILHTGFTAEDFMADVCGILSSPYEYNVLHFHPGYLDAYVIDNTSLTIPRVRDLQTLTDPRVKQWLKDNDVELVDFNAIYKK